MNVCTHVHIHKYIDLLYIRNTTGIGKRGKGGIKKYNILSHGVKTHQIHSDLQQGDPLPNCNTTGTDIYEVQNHQRANTQENVACRFIM